MLYKARDLYLAEQHVALKGIATNRRLDAERQVRIAASWRHR